MDACLGVVVSTHISVHGKVGVLNKVGGAKAEACPAAPVPCKRCVLGSEEEREGWKHEHMWELWCD